MQRTHHDPRPGTHRGTHRDPGDDRLADLTGRTRLGGGDGVTSSDELLDAGLGGLRFFERFLPRYQAWTGRLPGDLTSVADLVAGYRELGGIRFDRLRADAARLSEVHTALMAHSEDLAGGIGAMRELWTGDAADAAHTSGARLLSDGMTVAETVDLAGTLISMSADRAETAVLTRAQLVSSLDSKQVGGLTARQVDQVISAARGTAAPEQLFEMGALPAFAPLAGTGALADQDSFAGTGGQASGWMSQRGTQWLDDVFVPTVDAQYRAFQQYCATTRQDVSDSWSGMVQGVGGLHQQAPADHPAAPVVPVAAGSPALPTAAGPGTAGADPQSTPDIPDVPAPTAASAQPTVAAGASAGPAGAAAPSVPAPPGQPVLATAPDPGAAVPAGPSGLTLTTPDAQGHAQLTVTHPDGSTGQYPVDLGTGGPANPVVRDGSNTITLHRTGDGGPVTVTVDDGQGHVQSYPVDTGGGAGPGNAMLAGADPLGASGRAGSADGAPGSSRGSGGSSMAIGGTVPPATDSPSGGSTGGQPGGGSGAAAPRLQPGHYTAVGAMPAENTPAVGGVLPQGRGASGGAGMPMMPMMGGMGSNGGQHTERRGGRWNATEDFFGEDTSEHERIARLLDPEGPGD